jgi:hypothetical protein
MEEAQLVLGEMNDQSPFVRWTKEGRKYQLGSILITQQPGSIAPQLLSQGDNFFSFHLISAGDLEALQRVNAHFSRDVLMQLLNEPIRGNAYFWSAPHQPFVLSARIESFERRYGGSPAEPVAAGLQATAAERFEEEHAEAIRRFAELVKKAIETTFMIKLWEHPLVNGEKRADLIGIKLFNLCSGIAKGPNDPELEPFFRESDKGPVAKDQPVLEALKRAGLFYAVAYPGGDRRKGQTQWVLLRRDRLDLPDTRRLHPYEDESLVTG